MIQDAIVDTIREFCEQETFYRNGDTKPSKPTGAYEINCGLCEEFAMSVIEKLGGYRDGLYELDFMNLMGSDDDPDDEYFDTAWLEKSGYTLPDGVTVKALNRYEDIGGWSHVFIYCDGKYYDAECLQGVDTPFALPLVINNLNKNNLLT
jgi:hypothetical protein